MAEPFLPLFSFSLFEQEEDIPLKLAGGPKWNDSFVPWYPPKWEIPLIG